MTSTLAQGLLTPTPNPSPQGGGERAERAVPMCIKLGKEATS